MIAALFTLAGMSLFMLAVACHDGLIALARMVREVREHFGEDWKIYPDHKPE